MPDYTPPPQTHQIQVESRANVFRPDDRDRVKTSASYLGDDISVGLSHTFYQNPAVQSTNIEVEFEISPDTDASIGASLVEGDLVPEFSISHVLLDRGSHSIKLSFDRSLNDRDPRAVSALIQSNTISGTVIFGDGSNKASVEFNSDGVEVFENMMSISLTDNQFLTFNSYVRAASQESGFYWSPALYASAGVLIGFPVAQTESFTAHIGVQPGFSYEVKRSGPSEIHLGGIVGARARYRPSDELDIVATIGYSYGLNANVSIKWKF